MLKICKENKQSILEKVKNGHLDTASLCSKNLIVCDYFPVDKIEDGVYNKNESRDAFKKDSA